MEPSDQVAWEDALALGETELRARADAVSEGHAGYVESADGARSFGAVDRFGIQTLCFRNDGGRLRFATRADELAGPNPAIDLQAIFDYLYFHCIPSPRTIFRDVQRLPPGHYVYADRGSVSVKPYWTPRFDERSANASFDELREQFRRLLERSVARQVGSGPHACFLSGGTDSSTVAGMIGQVTGKPAKTYSIGFDAEGYDEMAYARIAARHFGTDHHEYYVTPDDLIHGIPLVAQAYDQPFGNSSVLPAYCCARMARDDGVERLLAGDGGDELFGGNSRYAKQRIFSWYEAIPGMARRRLVEPLLIGSRLGSSGLLKKARSYVEQASVPMPQRTQMYNLLLRIGIDDVLERDFIASISTEAPAALQQQVWEQPECRSELNRTLAFDWRFTLADCDLPKVCGATALAGVTVGFPLLDGELLTFSAQLPESYKLRGLKLRWFFKEALRGFLPDDIIVKRKQGFGLPFGVWCHDHTALNTMAVDSLRSLGTRGVVRPQFVDRLFRDLLPQHPGYYGEMVWILLMLEQWLRRHAPDFHAGR